MRHLETKSNHAIADTLMDSESAAIETAIIFFSDAENLKEEVQERFKREVYVLETYFLATRNEQYIAVGVDISKDSFVTGSDRSIDFLVLMRIRKSKDESKEIKEYGLNDEYFDSLLHEQIVKRIYDDFRLRRRKLKKHYPAKKDYAAEGMYTA